MTIYYKTLSLGILKNSPLVILSDIDNRDENSLIIKISGLDCSYVLLSGKRYRMTNGQATIDIKKAERGINEVTFIAGTKRLSASPFFNTQSGIERIPVDSTAVNAVTKLLTDIFDKLDDAEKRISVLEEKTIPKSILTFD